MQILYATDGSEGALAGARLLNSLPLGKEIQVCLLTVVGDEESVAQGEAALTAAQEAIGDKGTRFAREIRQGIAAEQILKMAEEQRPDLLVVGTRGQSPISRFLLGSVAERVARHALCSVLVARPLRDRLDKVIVGVDSSQHSQWAAAWLQRFPLSPECDVRLVTIVTPMESVSASRMMRVSAVADRLLTLAQQEQEEAGPRLDALAASFAAAGKRVTTGVRPDEPAPGLLAEADEQEADLIVVGSQGLSGIDRFLLGSVSEKVLRHAPCSVLVVREPGEG